MRRFLRQIHLWVGLVAGLVIVALGLSGSALVFRAELERFAARDWLHPAPQGESRSRSTSSWPRRVPSTLPVRLRGSTGLPARAARSRW
jgi:uncharacterized iron-regulated membrane protein